MRRNKMAPSPMVKAMELLESAAKEFDRQAGAAGPEEEAQNPHLQGLRKRADEIRAFLARL